MIKCLFRANNYFVFCNDISELKIWFLYSVHIYMHIYIFVFKRNNMILINTFGHVDVVIRKVWVIEVIFRNKDFLIGKKKERKSKVAAT